MPRLACSIVSEHEIPVETRDGVMTTFVVHRDGDGPFPVAFLYHDGIGYREQVKENARRFAADGYFVVVPDLFHREGEKLSFDPVRMRTDEAYRAELMRVVTAVTPEAAMADTHAALEPISGDPAAAEGPMVCVGYCMGARLALHAAEAKADGSPPPRASTPGSSRPTAWRGSAARCSSPSPRSTSP
jgi:carboxymethylenebutenolidase